MVEKCKPDSTNDAMDSAHRIEVQLDHLYRFSGMVGSTLRVDMLLEDALHPLLDIAEATSAIVALVRWGSAEGPVTKHQNWRELEDFVVNAEEIALLGTDILCSDTPDGLPEQLKERLVSSDGAHIAVAPLWAYGRPLGLLALSKPEGTFDSFTVKLLHTAGRQLALSVENARLFADLETSYHHLLYTQEETISTERTAAIGQLAATMAHEIRNPLATIFSSLSQIRKHAQITGDGATLLRIAEEEAMRLNRIITDLVEFARPGVPRFEEVQLQALVREAIHEARKNPEVDERVSFTIEEEEEEITAELDAAMLKKALMHVFDNAVAAARPEGSQVVVRIGAEVEQHKGKEIVILEVSDNGHGVKRELQNKVFEPFFSTKPSGIGLGLPTVARIVNDHSGMVSFNSSPEDGTTIRMAFYRVNTGSTIDRSSDVSGLKR